MSASNQSQYENPKFRGGNYDEMLDLLNTKGQMKSFIERKALQEKRAIAEQVSSLDTHHSIARIPT
jgi:hypothetical protein